MSKPKILARDGRPIEGKPLQQFEASLDRRILWPADNAYQSARRIWTGVIDPRCPALIVRCTGTSDVIRAIDFAHSNEIAVSVRSTDTVSLETRSAKAEW